MFFFVYYKMSLILKNVFYLKNIFFYSKNMFKYIFYSKNMFLNQIFFCYSGMYFYLKNIF